MKAQGTVILAAEQDDARRTWLRLLTQEQGMVQAAAFGARGSKRRFSGGLRPTMWGEGWGQIRAGKLRLEGFELDHGHHGLRAEPLAFAAAAYACELAGVLLAQQESDGVLYPVLVQVLAALARHEHAGGWLRSWEIAVLSHQGWMSEPGVCAICGVETALAFNAQSGQWRCSEHLTPGCQDYPVRSVQALASMHRHWSTSQEVAPWIRQGRFPELDSRHRAQIRQWCWAWIDQQLPRPLKSRAVLLEIAGK